MLVLMRGAILATFILTMMTTPLAKNHIKRGNLLKYHSMQILNFGENVDAADKAEISRILRMLSILHLVVRCRRFSHRAPLMKGGTSCRLLYETSLPSLNCMVE